MPKTNFILVSGSISTNNFFDLINYVTGLTVHRK